ncbi:MAG: hypothetical protein L0Z71_02180 [Anaerolineae bacterium]|nr:hypothetical protein [Anaerolineae bacterium]
MKKRIENKLKLLLGLPLWDVRRSASLVWFDFGEKISQVKTRKGETVLVAEYKIDTESAWHIRGKKGIVVASADRFYAGGKDPYKGFEDIDWEDKLGENRCDERLEKFIKQYKKSPLVVVSAEANAWGGLIINLSGGFVIEIFKQNTVNNEYWRMFESVNKGKNHFVVTARGAKIE